ncbi:hypothetical protein [Olleya sp. HaHaR_3_96]|uniref:hypothetical protein n=1 Tax=Olleya sp. HaHaR_3_96 TaxID=2745560 RepID=UPI001C4FA5E1|nr:hypothetical protein [Olleya sp. HaHaR_3_96]QXP60530.1 hypothetical protein H0I26_02475 [Olleya sp. HaHaR_3_96]
MEALKLKIFDVLTKKIAVSEFENWLYDSEEIIENIELNTIYFDAISINYKGKNWSTDLNNIALNYLGETYNEIIEINKLCSAIIESEAFPETHNLLSDLQRNFDFDKDYSVLWKLYILKDYFDLVAEGVYQIGTFKKEADYYSKKALEIILKNEKINEIKTKLEIILEDFKP